MQVKYISRVSLTPWRTTKQQRNLTICYGLFRQIVVDYQCWQTQIAEILTNCTSCHWSKELQRCWVRSGSGYNYCVSHSTTLLQRFHNLLYSRLFLSTSNIDTIYRVSFFVKLFLVDNGIQSDGSFTCLTVTNNQLTLTSSDWNHGIDSLDTCLQRLSYRLTI